MSRLYVFADESGDFNFSRRPGASRYFSVGTLTMRNDTPDTLTSALTRLRRDLAWRGVGLDDAFHATEDTQTVRDAVLPTLASQNVTADVTRLEKSKARPDVRANEATFYKYAWYYHFKRLASRELHEGDRLLVVVSQLGTKKKRATMRAAVDDVVNQCAWRVHRRVAFWPCASDPCLQAADYCLWAVARSHERRDDRALKIVRRLIRSDFDLWRDGDEHFY